MQLPGLLGGAETDRGGAAGERLVGYKVGCTSAKVQQAFGIPGPIYGRLWEGEQFHSPPEVSPMCLSLSSFNGLAIEGELMVQLVDTSGDSPAQWSAQAPCVFVCLCLCPCLCSFLSSLLLSDGLHYDRQWCAGHMDGCAQPRRRDGARHTVPVPAPLNRALFIPLLQFGAVLKARQGSHSIPVVTDRLYCYSVLS
eukprot:COSAG01_NODE_15195_length_1363_cov_0.848892_3_plen_196_part_00